MIALRGLQVGLASLGLAAVLIGASMIVFGAHMTANAFAGALQVLTGLGGPMTDLNAPNVDNELRFYAVFWMAYGLITLQSARQLPEQMPRARLLLGLFFLGGLARVFSVLTVGPPHLLFVILMWIELVLPPALLALSYAGGRK